MLKNFPIFKHYPSLVYLDNAATTQKLAAALKAEREFYLSANANPYRGVYDLSAKATSFYEASRQEVKSFLKAELGEIVFTRGTTEAINLVANSLGMEIINKGDAILTTIMEHHSNFLPWQQLAKLRGAKLLVTKLAPDGQLDLEDFKAKLKFKPKIVAIAHVSNTLGIVNDLELIIKLSHEAGAVVCVDGAQALAHLDLNLTKLAPDFYAFSGHKTYAAMGIGALYIAKKWVNLMPPWQLGGGMVARATLNGSSFLPLPQRLEAGTPNVAGAVSLAAALKWLKRPKAAALQRCERALTFKMLKDLASIPEISILAPSPKIDRIGVVSFNVNKVHPHDVATFLAQQQIAVRAGHHCAMPLMDYFKVSATVRASLAIYNTASDVDKLVSALKKLITWWRRRI